MNRRWRKPQNFIHPTIFYSKKLAKDLFNERKIALYCDLHGHSRRKNTFMYGNTDFKKLDDTRIFPFILSKISHHFSYDYCRFKMQNDKETTARIAMWREL